MYKINSDGSINLGAKSSGLGVVIRDSQGLLIAALSGCVQGVLAADMIEALALRRGILFASEIGLSRIQVESDACNLIKFLQSDQEVFSDHGNVVADCKMLFQGFSSVECSHVRRQGNMVAHEFAKFGALLNAEEVWLEEGPDWARPLLLADCSNSVS